MFGAAFVMQFFVCPLLFDNHLPGVVRASLFAVRTRILSLR